MCYANNSTPPLWPFPIDRQWPAGRCPPVDENPGIAGLAWTLRNMGLVTLAGGDVHKAEGYFRQSLHLYQELESQGGIAIALEGLAGVAAAQNQAEESARLMGAAAAIRESIEMPISPNSQSIYDKMLAPLLYKLKPQ